MHVGGRILCEDKSKLTMSRDRKKGRFRGGFNCLRTSAPSDHHTPRLPTLFFPKTTPARGKAFYEIRYRFKRRPNPQRRLNSLEESLMPCSSVCLCFCKGDYQLKTSSNPSL